MNFEYVKQVFETRKELFQQAQNQFNEVEAQIHAAEAGATQARDIVAETDKLRHERKNLFASLLAIGKAVFEDSKVKELDAAITAKRDDADRAADILAAQSELLERLYSERAKLSQHMAELRGLLQASQYELFTAEMEQVHIPEYLQAAEAFSQAAAKLAGYSKAAAMMRNDLLEKGIQTDAPVYGNYAPARIVDLRATGINLQQGKDSGHDGVFDISAQIEQYSSEAMERAKQSFSI